MNRDVKTANDFASDLGLNILDPMYDAAVMWFLKGSPISDSDYDQFTKDVYNNKIGSVHKKLLKEIEDWSKNNQQKTTTATKSKPRVIARTTLIPKSSLKSSFKAPKPPKINLKSTKLFCADKLNGPNVVPLDMPWDTDSYISKSILTNVTTIDKTLTIILKALIDKSKLDAKALEQKRIEDENKARYEKELRMETPGAKLKESASKILTPVKNVFDKILKFIFFTFLGKAFKDVVSWISDPKNKEKIKVIGKFIKDWWPALLGSYLLFGTRFGTLVKGVWGVLKFAIRALRKYPRSALALGIIGGLTASSKLNNNSESKPKPTPEPSSTPTPPKIQAKSFGGKIHANNLMLPSDGLVSEDSGMNITGAGPDTQLIAAMPGEIVMNKATVDAVGADRLLALNRRYGGPGANKQNFAEDIQLAAGGGMIGKMFSSLTFNPSKKSSSSKPITIPTPEHRLPEIRSALEAIKFTEGTNKSKNPYNTLFGFGSAPITKMSVKELMDLQMKDILPKRFGGGKVGFPKNSHGDVQSAASGAYQFMPNTLKMLVDNKILKMKDIMNEATQDRAAMELMKIRGVTSNLLRSEGMSRNIINKLAPEWASFPTLSGKSFYDQPAKPHSEIQNVYNKNLKNIISNSKQKLSVSPPNSKMKFNVIDLPPITRPLQMPTSSTGKPNDVELFSTKSPETRKKTVETYGLSI